jgi:hypothetical protein
MARLLGILTSLTLAAATLAPIASAGYKGWG